MVLSNKKLKQKIREDLVNSLSVAVAETNPDSVSNLQSQSLKELLDSASHKPRLSKREKRRNSDTCAREDEPDEGIRVKEVEGDVEKTDQMNRNKRKRDDTVEGELSEEGEGDEGTKEGDDSQKKKKNKKKKKKKKKKATKRPKKADEDTVEEKAKAEETQVDTESKEEDGVVPKKLYVGGIPYQSTEDEIRSYFRSCGVITKVDCKMRPEDGAFSGIAFITFETEDGANRALAFDRAAMGDRYLTIQQYVKTTTSVPRRRTSSGFVPEMVDGYHRVYIGNLAWDTTERDIRKLFSDCVINSVRLGKNKETGEFKGYAHVDFKDGVSVAMALKLDQQVISGRPVKICCALKERAAGDETNNMEETYAAAAADPTPALEANDGSYFAATLSSGKIKRRVCYECGEKGHLSTACPKKLQSAHDDQANAKMDQETVNARPATLGFGFQNNNGGSYMSYGFQNNNGGSYMSEAYTATNEAHSESLASAVSIGKIKRRVCYECGEKGHLSTACPKKLQNTDHTNSNVNHQKFEAGPIQVTTSYDLEKKPGDTDING
ncbi:unnamed protein product, partial [Thlaspi arvense]